MFKQIANMAQMMRQAQALQGQLHELKNSMQNLVATGTSPNGLIEVDASGDQRLLDIRIQPEARTASDLERQVLEAVNQALDNAKQMMAQELQAQAGNLPGMAEAFAKFGGTH